RQPPVVGEIAAGLILGPLFFGHYFPAAFAFLFSGSPHNLESVSTIGLVLFLFLTGAELNVGVLRQGRGSTLVITIASIAVPFSLGAIFSHTLRWAMKLQAVSPLGFLLFTGIAMSISALPVLARIIQDRKRIGRELPAKVVSTTLVCAAANDVIAWALLAIAVAITRRHRLNSSFAATSLDLLIVVAFALFMLFVVRPIAARLLASPARRNPYYWIPAAAALAFASARLTNALGVHAFLGAFLAGLCVPAWNGEAPELAQSFERVLNPIIKFTLPVFFVLTGLQMNPDIFHRHCLSWFAFVLAIAVIGKIGGTIIAARLTGNRWSIASQIAILLNTRGLVELIVLNVGLRRGVLNQELFSIMVLMALVTTAMTVPLLDLTDRIRTRRHRIASPNQSSREAARTAA
ncbi:MAG: cation:proton antiporter, partial [Acidobacteriota bacterium]